MIKGRHHSKIDILPLICLKYFRKVLFNFSKSKKGSFEESIFTLRTQIKLLEKIPTSVTILSVSPKEGKSLIASQLAKAFAQSGTKILLIDANLRAPNLDRFFHSFDKSSGLATLLSNFNRTSAIAELINNTSEPLLDFLPAGNIGPSDPLLLLEKEQLLIEIFKFCEERYPIVLVDTPALDVGLDAYLIAKHTKTSILVIRSGITPQEKVKSAYQSLKSHNIKVLGVVYNSAL